MTSSILNIIEQNTNVHGVKHRGKDWNTTNLAKIKAFVAIFLSLGVMLVHNSNLHDLWDNNPF